MPCPEKVIIKAYVSQDEYENIRAAAAQARLSISKFVAAVCLGYEPKSKVDLEAIAAIIQTKGDMARLGNLLKLLIDQSDFEEKKITDLLSSMQETRNILHEILYKLHEKVSEK
jgi:uncharacterized protein (DUF1778 family)